MCDFESGEVCGNFRSSGWILFLPKIHLSDTEYEPEVDHTHGNDNGNGCLHLRIQGLEKRRSERGGTGNLAEVYEKFNSNLRPQI